MGRWPSLLALVALMSASAAAQSAEIDSLTRRREPLADSRAPLERRLNGALHAGVERANEVSQGCDADVLYREVRRSLVSPFIGHRLAEALNEDEGLDKRRILRVDSIYADLGLLDNISVHLKDLSAVVRIGEALVGVDKMGHFVVEGWEYFEIASLDGDGIEAAMDWGERTERTYFGRYTTGVYSYADLVADFEGMRFWLRLLGHDDPLNSGWRASRSHVVCRRRFWLVGAHRWHLARKVDLDRHVSPVWDEGVNCSSYRSPRIEALVGARVAALSQADDFDYSCPIEPDACAAARERYGDLSPRLLHPACLEAEARSRSWWRIW